MNRPAARSKAHVVMARRPGDVPVLTWTKNRLLPSTKLEADPPPPDQHPCSREPTLPRPPTKASDTPRNRSRQIWRTTRRPSCRSEGSTNTRCHQLRDAAVKVAAGVGVELRQFYLPGRRSHHSNDAPQQTSPNPNYMKERGPSSLLPPEWQEEGEGTSVLAGVDWRAPPPLSLGEEEMKWSPQLDISASSCGKTRWDR
jgi:hypothetical protein